MRWLVKALFGFVVVAVPLLFLVVGAGMLWLSRSLPPANGAAQVEGLTGPVTIARDREGVPHIIGRTRGDVAAGLGFVHAQERLWQMEVNRRAGQGRLSELFGEATIGTDIWLRTMGIEDAAEASLKVMDGPTRAMLEGYARGINVWLTRESRFFAARLPVEFVVLGAEPDLWTPADVLISIKMMSVTLSANVDEEITRLALARLGFDGRAIDDLLPPVDADTPPPMPDIAALLGLDNGPVETAATGEGADMSRAESYGLFEAVTSERASNNWVVSGARTASGKPVVANDPHLGLMAPSIWYLAHLQVTEELGRPRNLVGASLPGTPFVFLGRNDFIAWGFTNTGTDAQDIFIERVNPDHPDEYMTPMGRQPFGKAEEVIRVAGGEDVTFTRRWTRHGPVLPAAYKQLSDWLPENTVAALQWVALAGDDTTANAGPKLFEMETVADYQEGMEPFLTPMQSMVVADIHGDIGFVAPGRVPLRDPANRVMGRAPVPGWNAVYDWRGFVSSADLPRQTNPEVGAIATANSRLVTDDYAHFLTYDWEESFRQDRLDDLVISATEPHTPERSRQIQGDIRSAALLGLRDRFISALQDVDLPPELEGFVRRLEAWDGAMRSEASEPLVMMAWTRYMTMETFADDLGPAFDQWFRLRIKVLYRVLDGEASRDWCDRAGSDEVERCSEIVAAALQAAIADLKRRYGGDPKGWVWGEVHHAYGEHRPFAQVGLLAPIFNVVVPHQGGPFTLDRGQTRIGDDEKPYANTHGASFRGIYDLADLDRSTFIQTTGQSGNVFSRHYRDFAQRWAEVKAIEIPAALPVEPESEWMLIPAR